MEIIDISQINAKKIKTPLATVVILTYKRFETLERAVQSVLSQDYPEIEVIVQDDGSADFDRQTIESLFGNKGGNIRQILIRSNETNMGTVRNFNSAVEVSHGEVIIPLACDDAFYSSHAVSAIMKAFTEGIDVCTAKREGRQSGTVYPSREDIDLLKFGSKERLLARLFYSNFISGASTCYSKSYLDRMGGFDTDYKLMEDYPMAIKTIAHGKGIFFLDEITILYDETGVSSKGVLAKGINPLFISDNKTCYEKDIMPNLGLIRNRQFSRYIGFTYEHVFGKTRLQKAACMLKYPDVLAIKARSKATGKNEFELIMG